MTSQLAKKAEAWSARFNEPMSDLVKRYTASVFFDKRLALFLSLIHISEPTRQPATSRMPSSA